MLEDVLEAYLQLVMACECEDGYPFCVGVPVPLSAQNDLDTSPKGRIPDKEAALIRLHSLLNKEPYTPKPVKIPGHLQVLGEGSSESRGCGACGGGYDETCELPMKRSPESVEARIRRQLARLAKS